MTLYDLGGLDATQLDYRCERLHVRDEYHRACCDGRQVRPRGGDRPEEIVDVARPCGSCPGAAAVVGTGRSGKMKSATAGRGQCRRK